MPASRLPRRRILLLAMPMKHLRRTRSSR